MSTILEHPEAQTLLDQTDVAPQTVNSCSRHLTPFIQRYLPCFYRKEQRQHADTILHGKLTGLERKTTEPIANQANQKHRPLQLFVGAGMWSDDQVLVELRRHVRAEIADPKGVLVLDPSAVAKKGTESCGVQRQWCGRLGKIDNCQVGVYLGYATPRGQALVAARLFLPEARAADQEHRKKTYVPKEVTYQEKWRIGLDFVRGPGRDLPHAWVVGDDEFGRVSELRALLRFDHERYALDVPCNTQIRDLSGRRPPSRPGGSSRVPLWESVADWAERQPKKRWRYFTVRDGEKGPLRVKALQQWVQTKDEDGGPGPRTAGGDSQRGEESPDLVRVEQRAQGDLLGGGGGSPWRAASDRGIVSTRERGSGAGGLRSAQLDGLAPPHDADAAGLVVSATGATPVWGKKIRV